MELREALSHIAEIRAKVAATQQFRGYRAAPVAASGCLAILAAVLQPAVVPDPGRAVNAYLGLWLATAGVSAAAAGAYLLKQYADARLRVDRDITRLAVGQFAPCLLAGALLTLAIGRQAPEFGWALPGLWQVVFGLGICASCRLLPKATAGVGLFYLLSGAVVLAVFRGDRGFDPWAMGVPFAAGQFATAGILYWNLERPRD